MISNKNSLPMTDVTIKKPKKQYGSLVFLREGLRKFGISERVISCKYSSDQKQLTISYKNRLNDETIMQIFRSCKTCFYLFADGERLTFKKSNTLLKHLKEYFFELFLWQEYRAGNQNTVFMYLNTLTIEKRDKHYTEWREKRLSQIQSLNNP